MDDATPDLAQTVEQLAAEVARLRSLVEVPGGAIPAAEPSAARSAAGRSVDEPAADGTAGSLAEPVADGAIDRRSALRRAGLMAAGAVAGGAAIVGATASPAAAATVSGSGSPGVAGIGVGGDGVIGSTTASTYSGVYGATDTAGSYGMFARNTAGTALGVEGTPATGGAAATIRSLNDEAALKVNGKGGGIEVANTAGTNRSPMFVSNSGINSAVQISTVADGVLVNGPGSDHPNSTGIQVSNVGNGLYIYQSRVAILIGSNAPPPPQRTGPFGKGSIDWDGTDLWVCVESGSPGVWRRIGGAQTAGSLTVLPAPARIYDSRPGSVPTVGSKTKLAPNVARTLDLKVNGSTVPAGATAALLTVLLVNATNGNGNATVWANGVARPQANTLVWGGSAGRFTATAVSALDSQARIQVSASLATDIVIDVVGYYR